ncbi:MAG: hypothetical protein IJ794_18865 [Lachnospiraceae bacterium]|nr:hypothetical protein [Lachnospiraceae bacterium]
MRNLQIWQYKGMWQKGVAAVSCFSLVCGLVFGAIVFGGCGQAGQGAGNGDPDGRLKSGKQDAPGAEAIVYDAETVWKSIDTVSLGKLEEPVGTSAEETDSTGMQSAGGEGGIIRLRKYLSGSDGGSFERLYDVTGVSYVSYGIAKYDLTGKLVESNRLPEWKREEGESSKVVDAVIWKDTTWLLTEDKLIGLAPDSEGSGDGGQISFELEGWRQRQLVSAENSPYLAELEDGWTVLRKLSEIGLQEDIAIPVQGEKLLATGDLEKNGAVYLSAGNRLFRYDVASAETRLVLQWDKSGIANTYLLTILSADEQEIKILYFEQDQILLKTLKPTTDKDGRAVLTVMTVDDGKIFRDMVYAFNQSNERYRVELVSPLDKSGMEASLEEWEEARTRLQLLLTTPEAPDLVDLGFLQNWESYARQEVFEDLTPYLEASTVLDAELYIPSALACGQAAGKQVFIPRAFYMKMLYGQEQYLGTESGWTLRELLDLREKHKDIPLFASGYSAESVLNRLLGMSMEEFVDVEQNTCDFCNLLFYDLLACAAYEDAFTGERQWESHGLDRLLSSSALLDEAVIMDEVNYLWYTNVIATESDEGQSGSRNGTVNSSGDEAGSHIGKNAKGDGSADEHRYENLGGEIRLVVKGYPSKNGGSSGTLCATHGDGVWLSGFCNLAISSMGTQKAGAWEFIEFAQEYEPDYGLGGFFVRKDRLERNLHTPRYTQEEMQGVPLREYTAEDAERLAEIIGNLSHKTSRDEQLLKIVEEEAQVYFRGQKSAEETAKVIQNRVQLYLWENE